MKLKRGKQKINEIKTWLLEYINKMVILLQGKKNKQTRKEREMIKITNIKDERAITNESMEIKRE